MAVNALHHGTYFSCTEAICCQRARHIPATICCPALGDSNFYCAEAICCQCSWPIPATIRSPALWGIPIFITLRPFAANAPSQSRPPFIAPHWKFQFLLCCGHLPLSHPANLGHHSLPCARNPNFYCAAAIRCHRAWPIQATICCPAPGIPIFIALRPFAVIMPCQSRPPFVAPCQGIPFFSFCVNSMPCAGAFPFAYLTKAI
jgi:hypothetical protein